MINSILDTDLYKFTTSYAYMKLFPYAEGIFTFIDREGVSYTPVFLEELKQELYKLKGLKLTDVEKRYMTNNVRFIPPYYWEWLSTFRFNPDNISVYIHPRTGELCMDVQCRLYEVTLYEVPLLALISEMRSKYLNHSVDLKSVERKTLEKIQISNQEQMLFSEFGTRRRHSSNVQDLVCYLLSEKATYCTGTSNCHYALKYGMKMMGTHPHEWFMFHGAIYGPKQANYLALENWSSIYDGDLGIALTDTYGSDIFFSNFSKKLAKLFDGVRWDSGDAYAFIQKTIKRYNEHGINPLTKTIVFSDALDFVTAPQINRYCKGLVNASFGIGTNLTNDTGYKPANMVMKLTKVRLTPKHDWQNCVKLSDVEGKHTGDPETIKHYLYEINALD